MILRQREQSERVGALLPGSLVCRPVVGHSVEKPRKTAV